MSRNPSRRTTLPLIGCPPISVRAPSSCARAIASAARSSHARSPTSPTGRRRRSTACAGCSPARTLAPLGAEPFEIVRALAHGHVAAALGTVRRLGLDKALPKGPERRAKLILAMIVARIIEPAAKLATACQLSEATAAHSLGAVLGLGEVDEDELYAALDLLGRSQTGVEKVLAQRHLEGWRARALRRHLELSGGAAVRTGAIRLQPRSSPRPAADRLRPVVHDGRLPGRRRGLRRQSRRSEHARQSGAEAAHALSAEAHRAGRRSRHDHPGAHRRRPRARRLRLDHRAARPDRPGPGCRGRPPAALAVRRARHGGDRLGRLSRRASHRLSQPRTGGRARAQARRTHRCDREGAGQDLRGDRAKAQSAPRQGQDRPQGRRRDRPSPHGPSISSSPSPTQASPGRARPRRSPPKPRSTASM